MDKLYSSLKVTDDGLRTAITTAIHNCVLMNKETLPEGLPKNTWVYVESGFIKKTLRSAAGVEVYDLLPEGSCVLLTDCSTAAEDRMGVCIQAIEPTVLYYFLPKEIEELSYKFPSFGWEHMAITMCAAADLQDRATLWLVPPASRFRMAVEKYPFLLRAGATYLADYLRLTGREHSELLGYFN